jgi:integrase
MPQKSRDTHHILEGKATLFKRVNSPVWHVRYKAHGKWERMTTKCDSLREAKSRAVDIVTNAWFREKNNLPAVSKRFKSVAKLAISRMEDLMASGQGKATYKTYCQAINNYLIPILGNHNVDRIDNAVLVEFQKQRLTMMGKTPSASVLNNHNSALNRVFDEALERGYMTKLQVPVLRNDGLKSERRPDFTLEEYRALHRGMRSWLRDARQGLESELRAILYEYVLVLANTGIRAGTEAMNLRWRNVYYFDEDGQRYLAMKVRGKTGQREVIARHSVARYLDRLRLRNPKFADGTFEEFLRAKHDQYVFRHQQRDMTTPFGRMFARLLDRTGLQTDPRTGKERTLYSLRHYYATMALTYDRVSVYVLAQHMGTSVKMIESHYGHVMLRKKASEIAGGRFEARRLG